MFVAGVEGDFRAGCGFLHERADGGLVQCGCGFQADVFDDVAAALQSLLRVVEGSRGFLRLEEEEADPAGEDGDGEDGFRRSLGGTEADGEGVVVVVDEFERGGIAGARRGEDGFGERGDFGCEFRDEGR